MTDGKKHRARFNRIAFTALHDGVMSALSFVLALYLRMGDSAWDDLDHGLVAQYAITLSVLVLIFLRLTGLYRGIWRYASLNDLFAIARAVTAAVLVFTVLSFILTRLDQMPRTALVIDWFVLMALLAGPRIAYRLFKDGRLDRVMERDAHRRIPVLLAGAGDGAELFISEMRRDRDAAYEVLGIVGFSDTRVGRMIHNQPVLGTVDELPQVLEKLGDHDRRPQKLIITSDTIDGATIRKLVDLADGLGLGVSRMPKVTELRTGAEDTHDILTGMPVRPIAVEDLLGRPQRVLDREAMAALIRGRRVLVTGAGGTIGSELVRQIADLAPAHLTLFDVNEFQLYTIDMDLSERHRGLPRTACLGDVRDRARLDQVMAEWRPELVFHAAAYKHVPMVEANPVEGILTNVIGTRNLAEACRAAGIATMVMISTDKAVHPSNIMGATKRLAESICQALDIEATRGSQSGGQSGGQSGATRFITVRFGNVLGSTGSVVPLFQRQLAAGGPLTVTHPDVFRFFMTVREAVELVLQASADGTKADGATARDGGIFVLEMGEPVRIADLARQMIRLAGRVPDRDIKIEFIGLRPGEKLSEELFHEGEALQPTGRDGILLATPRIVDYAVLAKFLDDLEDVARARRRDRAVALLGRLVPDYKPESPAGDQATDGRPPLALNA
ncbi:MAG TPA: nucleoside-diphosphate sugar epimerase/dehydratase [Stellaceae bacterium]|nr:nucleoside-diphosphate sugar epimerase/dehydratase [Stellaceae bacterium]